MLRCCVGDCFGALVGERGVVVEEFVEVGEVDCVGGCEYCLEGDEDEFAEVWHS